METLAGLWIDHREAVIVILSDKGHLPPNKTPPPRRRKQAVTSK